MGILFELFLSFFKIGLVSFGGGYAMVSIIQKEVMVKGWLTAAEYARVVTISQMTPGPIAVNTATYVGAKVCDSSPWFSFLGSFVATLGVSLPSFIIMLLVAGSLKKLSDTNVLKWVMGGIRPAVIGFMLAAVIFFGKLAFLKSGAVVTHASDAGAIAQAVNPLGLIIGLAAFGMHYKFGVGPIHIILITGLAGLLLL